MVMSIVLSVSQAIMIAMFTQLQYVKFDHNKVTVSIASNIFFFNNLLIINILLIHNYVA